MMTISEGKYKTQQLIDVQYANTQTAHHAIVDTGHVFHPVSHDLYCALQ